MCRGVCRGRGGRGGSLGGAASAGFCMRSIGSYSKSGGRVVIELAAVLAGAIAGLAAWFLLVAVAYIRLSWVIWRLSYPLDAWIERRTVPPSEWRFNEPPDG